MNNIPYGRKVWIKHSGSVVYVGPADEEGKYSEVDECGKVYKVLTEDITVPNTWYDKALKMRKAFSIVSEYYVPEVIIERGKASLRFSDNYWKELTTRLPPMSAPDGAKVVVDNDSGELISLKPTFKPDTHSGQLFMV